MNSKTKKSGQIKYYLLLHFNILISSVSGIMSKIAGTKTFLSLEFFIFYGLMLFCLLIYAILWQQVLKYIPLVTAFCNKAVGIIWGMLWGYCLFNETITINNIVGAIIVITGIIVVVTDK